MIESSGVCTLHRAIVAVPDISSTRVYAERVVFFEANIDKAGSQLQQILALVWGVDTTNWCEDGSIYNVNSASELERDSWAGKIDGDGLYLFETGCGGAKGIGPGRIHYARAADVDCFVSPRHAKRLQRGLWIIEALYADEDSADILTRLRKEK